MKYFNIFDPVTNATTSAGLSNEMKTYYSDYLIDFAKPQLVHNQFGQKQTIPANNGKTVEFRKYSPLAKATELVEGVDGDGKAMTVGTVTATVKQYGDYIKMTDVLLLTAIDNNLVQAVELLGDQAGRTLDTVIREVINAGTNVQYGANAVTARHLLVGGESSGNHYMNVDTIRRAVRCLRAKNAKTIDGKNYVGIIHPDVSYDLMSDPKWESVSEYAEPENWFAGEIGRIGGVRFVETTEAKIFHADALADTALAVNKADGYTGAITAIKFDGATVASNALKGRKILINGVVATVSSNTADTITVPSTNFGTVADNTAIYAGEAGAKGRDVYSTLVLGANAYGVIDVAGGGLQTIVKDKSQAGSFLDLYATAGWKALSAGAILEDNFMVRVETACTFESGAN